VLITKTVMTQWNVWTKEWYENKGYVFTKYSEPFEVKVEDLSNGSHALVDIECDGCGEILKDVIWQTYIKCVKEDGKYYCHTCAINLYASENMRKTRLKNSISFYKWCYDNLSKELADYILSRWDYEKNIDKKGKILSPTDVSFRSMGLNRKGYWFKCLEHPEHNSEQKSINAFVGGLGNINCKQCNMLITTHPEFIKYLADKNDAYKYSYGSGKSIDMICPDCGFEKKLSLSTLTRQGFGCTRCSDGVSYPQKFTFNVLEQVEISFLTEISRKIFEWCKNYKYDFYINIINTIIETHGIFHYIESKKGWKSKLDKVQNNDKDKEDLAKENNIKNYIVIDCRYSNIEWIKNSIMNRDPSRPDQPCLAELLAFKEKDIDWLKCHEFGCSNFVKKSCELWNSGINNTQRIAEVLKVHRATIINYLKQGVILGWCDYNAKNEMSKGYNCRKVICLTTGEIFNSLVEAGTKYNTDTSWISKCCKDIKKTTKKHPETGEKLQWMYLSEYQKLNEVTTIG